MTVIVVDYQAGHQMTIAVMRKGEQMNDLISRQDAIDALDTGLWGVEWDKALATAMLKALPSAEPKQKTGNWIVHTEIENVYGGIYIECSECGERYVVQHLDDEIFCRTCGSKNGR